MHASDADTDVRKLSESLISLLFYCLLLPKECSQ
ncbi:hypothetical protein EcWSU1_00660 [Enterobacter ludwigii]|uniref:Uncharacterized protein n=1 Tax=Enterobacter ludwigii TaxID=299767 RepID=G8LM16_9ENTR|nr:hypothetical protein EcWSU1_00660 [Enterobacter ludwigii]